MYLCMKKFLQRHIQHRLVFKIYVFRKIASNRNYLHIHLTSKRLVSTSNIPHTLFSVLKNMVIWCMLEMLIRFTHQVAVCLAFAETTHCFPQILRSDFNPSTALLASVKSNESPV